MRPTPDARSDAPGTVERGSVPERGSGPGAARAGRLAAATALLLLSGASGATGWLALAVLPVSPDGFLRLAVPALALLLLAVALPGGAGPRGVGARLLATLLAAAPFLVWGSVAASGGTRGLALPGLGLLLAGAAALVLLPAPARVRGAAGLLLSALLVGDAVLAGAGHALLPASSSVLRTPVAYREPAPAAGLPLAPAEGPRAGCFVRAPGTAPADDDERSVWTVAVRGTLPQAGPVLRVLDDGPPERVERVAAGSDTLTVVHDGPVPRHPFDLSAYEAVLLERSSPWFRASGSEGERFAAALSGFVRRGGLLLGPAPGEPWPAALGRALGEAGRSEEAGPAGARRLGLGHVVRAADRSEALAALARGDLRHPPGTLFDGLREPPLPPEAFTPWRDEPAARRPMGALLAAFTLALLLLAPLARRLGSLPVVLGLPVAAALAGVLLAAPPEADLVAHGLVLDLGGPGGRRVEAVWLSTGERGYAGRIRWQAGGALRDLGAAQSGEARLAPGTSGWLVRHGSAKGADLADPEDRQAGFLRPFLRGPVLEADLRYARGRTPLPLTLEGVAPVLPYVLSLR